MTRTPDATSRKSAERAARDERLAQALRDNLRRRKEQVRAQAQRAAEQREDHAGETGQSASRRLERRTRLR